MIQDRVFNELQLAQQEDFRQATQYTIGVKDNPLYLNLAKEADAIPYDLPGNTGGLRHSQPE